MVERERDASSYIAGIELSRRDWLRGHIALDRFTLGGICTYKTAHSLMNQKLPARNAISENVVIETAKTGDGRIRYSPKMRYEIYSHLIGEARRWQPELTIALCLEEDELRTATNLSRNKGKCNCVL